MCQNIEGVAYFFFIFFVKAVVEDEKLGLGCVAGEKIIFGKRNNIIIR